MALLCLCLCSVWLLCAPLPWNADLTPCMPAETVAQGKRPKRKRRRASAAQNERVYSRGCGGHFQPVRSFALLITGLSRTISRITAPWNGREVVRVFDHHRQPKTLEGPAEDGKRTRRRRQGRCGCAAWASFEQQVGDDICARSMVLTLPYSRDRSDFRACPRLFDYFLYRV